MKQCHRPRVVHDPESVVVTGFMGLGLGASTPDEDTVRLFGNKLTEAGTLKQVMKAFDWQLKKKGYIPPLSDWTQSLAGQRMSGQIVDASLVPAPKQRNTEEEKAAIKAGKTADDIWPDEPNKAAEKDAKWSNPYHLDQPNASSRSTQQCRMPSMFNVTLYTAPSLNSFGLTHSRIGRAVLCLAERADVAGSLRLNDLTCQCPMPYSYKNQRRQGIKPSRLSSCVIRLSSAENVHKRYLIHVAGFNLGILMRALFGSGTPKQAASARTAAVLIVQADQALAIALIHQGNDEIATLVIISSLEAEAD